MIKHSFILLFKLISIISISGAIRIEVEYIPQFDMMIHNGKSYLPHPISARSMQNVLDDSEKNQMMTTGENQSQAVCEEELVTGAELWGFIFIVAFLTVFAGLMSGLTVGYLSIDDLVLELRSTSGTDEEKHHAEKVLPILANRHWLLVTLLLMNAAAMEALPIFLDRIVPSYLAVIISVSLVLLFGEVIPQAICTGPDQVKIASMVAPFTKALMIISSPLAYPIAKLLDRLLGEHHKSRFLNNDLKTLIELHTFNALNQLHQEEEAHMALPSKEKHSSSKMGLHDEEANLMISALEIREKKIIELMIPFKDVFKIDYDEKIDKFKVNLILERGYSRIPVYSNHDEHDVAGLLRIKQLIAVDFNFNKSLRQLGVKLMLPLVVRPTLTLIDLLREFRKGKSHMAFITENVSALQEKFEMDNNNSVSKNFRKPHSREVNKDIIILGIITLEDVIEHMFNLEILDEDDYEDIQKAKNQRSNSRITTYYSKTLAKSLIKDESSRLDFLVKESYSKRKSIKDSFLKKMDIEAASLNKEYLKDSFI